MKLFFSLLFAATALALTDRVQTNVDKEAKFDSSDFVIDLDNNPKVVKGTGGSISSMNLGTLPSLQGAGISLSVIHLEPCGLNQPHIHPRASEALFVVEGSDVSAGFIQENGGKVITNKLQAGLSTFFPQGSIHFQLNNDCKPATLVADPGVLTIVTNFFMLPDGVIEASLGEGEDDIRKAKGHIPIGGAPALAAECRKRCGFGLDEKKSEQEQSYESESKENWKPDQNYHRRPAARPRYRYDDYYHTNEYY